MSQTNCAISWQERLCEKAAETLLEQHKWRLLSSIELARRALEHLRGGIARDALRAATFAYSQTLHSACSGVEGLERQNQAYTELFRYLYDSAIHRYADMSQEIAQHALANIFTDFARCRQPGTFLAFAFQKMLDAARTLRRPQLRLLELSAGSQIADEQQPDPADTLASSDLRARFEQLAQDFLHRHPRAAKQFTALRLKFIDGLEDQHIAAQLGVSVGAVYVLRARAIEKLRDSPEWHALAIEFGILPEP